jgi:hypothetical protein
MNQLYEVAWQDAAYSYDDELPEYLPGIQKTTGYITEETEGYINIAVSFKSDSKRSAPSDGFVIPRGAILSIKKIN